MDLSGEKLIAAPRDQVWQALSDPEMLKACIPGCEEIHKTSDTSFEAKVRAKVGPVSATFTGAVTLSDLNPPESYTISGEGKGGVAGFAKGGAKVKLTEQGKETLLSYQVTAQVGGKIAQIGARLIDGTAKKLADEFFSNLQERLGASGHDAHSSDAHHGEKAHHDDDHGHDLPAALSDEVLNRDVGQGAGKGVWVTAGIVAALIALAIFGLGGAGH